MKHIFVFAVLAAYLFVSAPHAQADDAIDWEAQFRGLDSVVVGCRHTLKTKYTVRICKRLRAHARDFLAENGIPHEDLGTWYRHDPWPKNPGHLKHPLNLTIHVRATRPNPLGMDIRVNAEVVFEKAAEAGSSDAPPRTGRLLLWQHGFTAAGSRKKLERAITNAIKTKTMKTLFDVMKAHWPRPAN